MEKTLPKISVIIPVYRVEQYLEECVDSILVQEYPLLEIILVDDGSPDRCPQICEEYAQKDNRVVAVHKKNGGLASARNAGLDRATGEYIAFVDSDDWIEPQTYSKMLDFAIEKNLDIVCCEISRISNGKEIERYHFYDTGTVLTGREVTREILLDRIGSQVVKGVYKAQCWKEIRFPEGRLYEDIPVTFRAFSRAENVGFIAEPYYLYRANEESISLSCNPIKPYHQYLGFKEHYEYAVLEYHDIIIECCANAAMYAISTCFHFYSEKSPILKEPTEDAECFLLTNKKLIMSYPNYRNSRRIALQAFYLSKPLFRCACRLFNKSGMQKALHFDMK